MTSKEVFASYLEELAQEIRAFELNKTMLEEIYHSLKDFTEEFYKTEYEKTRIRGV